jgi:hypothetical protein
MLDSLNFCDGRGFHSGGIGGWSIHGCFDREEGSTMSSRKVGKFLPNDDISLYNRRLVSSVEWLII